jgi:putative endonuclease
VSNLGVLSFNLVPPMTRKLKPRVRSRKKTRRASSKPWYLYLLDCADGTTYTGITTDPPRRLQEHNSGRGARYTAQRQRRPVRLLGIWRFPDRANATRAEVRLKRRSATGKRRLAAAREPFEEAPFCHRFLRGEDGR